MSSSSPVRKLPPAAQALIKPHAVRFDFSTPPMPLHWNHSAVETHLMNALGVLFPFGERFFLRTAGAFLPADKSSTLHAQVKGFIAQEARHAHQHELTLETLDAQGLKASKLAGRLTRFFEEKVEPKLPPKLRLSAVAAVEHFTATIAEYVFTSEMLRDAEPRMKSLFIWHACEEIEHKCVAYDLLQEVDAGYGLRAAGMGISFTLLLAFWYSATWALLRQDPSVTFFGALKQWLWAARHHRVPLWVMTAAIADYLRPSFHPSDHDNFHRARDYFASLEGPEASASGAA